MRKRFPLVLLLILIIAYSGIQLYLYLSVKSKLDYFNELLGLGISDNSIDNVLPDSFSFLPWENIQLMGLLDRSITQCEHLVTLRQDKDYEASLSHIDDINSYRAQAAYIGINTDNLDNSFLSFKLIEATTEFSIERFKQIHNNFETITSLSASYRQTFKDYKDYRKNRGESLNNLWGMTDNEIIQLTQSLTPEQKAAQILVFNTAGTYLNENEKKLLNSMQPGGIIHLGYNISSRSQITDLNKDIQKSNSLIPLFIMVDQEGGLVQRVPWDDDTAPDKWTSMTDDQVCMLAKNRSKLLFKLGFNVNLAPVVDLSYPKNDFLNSRTISSDPAIVTQKAQKFIECSQQEKIFTSLKHYPGHGPSSTDSHFYMPIINKTKEEWLDKDALPFKNITNSEFIMTGHLWYKQIDPSAPSTLSKVFLKDILKREFQSNSIVITDDLNMLYRSSKRPIREIMKDAINAGNDILLFVGTPESKEKIHSHIVDMLKKGEISEKDLDASIIKILKLKRKIVN